MINWGLKITFCIMLSMILGIWALFGPIFPYMPWCHKNPKTGKTLPSDGSYTWVRLQLRHQLMSLSMTFCISNPMIWVFGPNFPDLLQCPKYAKTSINQPSDGLYIWVRFHLVWNVEFNFLDDFLCTGVHDLGYLDPIILTCPNYQNILNRFNLTLRLPLPLSKASFDVKCDV